MEPNRPNMEAIPNKDMRNSVGNISAVNTYIVLNDIVIAYLLLKNINSLIHKWSENKILYYSKSNDNFVYIISTPNLYKGHISQTKLKHFKIKDWFTRGNYVDQDTTDTTEKKWERLGLSPGETFHEVPWCQKRWYFYNVYKHKVQVFVTG